MPKFVKYRLLGVWQEYDLYIVSDLKEKYDIN